MRRILAAALAASLILPATVPGAEPPPPPPAAGDEEVRPRALWGMLLNFALSRLGSYAFDLFAQWLKTRLVGGEGDLPTTVTSGLFGKSGAAIAPRGGAAPRGVEAVVGTPDSPLRFVQGQENYQGAHLAVLVAGPDGRTFTVRPVSQGFRSGERFKLRVVSTFGGEFSLENINPRGERRQVYPADPRLVVGLQPGQQTLLPLGEDEFLQFTGATGREQLVVHLTDPRAQGSQASAARVFRQDLAYGSNFVQEVGPGRYAAIVQSIELRHEAP